jgi:hypothetical protein
VIAADVAALLIRPGEMPGFGFDGPRKVSASAIDFAPTPKDASRLRSEGFADGATQQLRGTGAYRGAIGISVGFVLATPSAAQRELVRSLAESIASQGDARIVRFTVPGVPTARGFTATSGADRATNVVFRSGRCMLLIGDIGRQSGLPAAVKTAVRAVYRRIAATCR